MAYKKMLFALFAFPLIFGGCSPAPEGQVLARALEDIKTPLIHMDERFALYEGALQDAQEYVTSPGTDTLEAAKKSCMKAIAEISALTAPESTLTAGERGALIEIGITMADYDVPFTYADNYKYENIRSLTFISYYLDNAPELNDVLEYSVDYYIRLQAEDRKIFYARVNHLFCGFSDAELGDFKAVFLPGLLAFSADGLPWETDKTVIQAKVDYWFTEMEADTAAFKEFEGEQYLILLEEQARYKDSLIEAGYSLEEADKIAADIDELTREMAAD